MTLECAGGVALVRDFYVQTVAVAAGAGVAGTDSHGLYLLFDIRLP